MREASELEEIPGHSGITAGVMAVPCSVGKLEGQLNRTTEDPVGTGVLSLVRHPTCRHVLPVWSRPEPSSCPGPRLPGAPELEEGTRRSLGCSGRSPRPPLEAALALLPKCPLEYAKVKGTRLCK